MIFWRAHPADGVLRAWMDRELAGRRDRQVAEHLAGCARCEGLIARFQAGTAFIAQQLAALEPSSSEIPDDVELARITTRVRLQARTSGTAEVPTHAKRAGEWRTGPMAAISTPRFRPVLLAAALLVAVGALFVSPSAQTLANDLLKIFRVKRFVAVTFDPNQPFRGFYDLSQFGEASPVRPGSQRQVASAAEASKLAGFQVRVPQSPNLAGQPSFMVSDRVEGIFTFNVAKARAYLASRGETSFKIPDQFDGAKLTVTIPPIVVVSYGGNAGRGGPGGMPVNSEGLVLMQAQSPTAHVDGRVSLDDLRKLLLSMPGIPADTLAQLRAIDDWTNTLPIPVPKNLGVARDIRVNGNPGLALADNTGAGGAVLWTQDNLVFAVAGARTADDLMRIASSVR